MRFGRRLREWLTVFKNSNQIELVSEAKQLSNDLIAHFACCEPLNIDTFSIDFEEITHHVHTFPASTKECQTQVVTSKDTQTKSKQNTVQTRPLSCLL